MDLHIADSQRDRARRFGWRLPAAARDEEPAPFHHLRQRGRRQEHADRAPAVRHQACCSTTSWPRCTPTAGGTARQNGEIDFALLVDGLEAEREQGITIDVAYRYFDTARASSSSPTRPGHEQYTRNMATGASTADVAVRAGRRAQGPAHADAPAQLHRARLLGIRHVLLAVNKMDLVGYDQATFDKIETEYRELAGQLGITHVTCIPVSALKGDNMLERSEATPWYHGHTLLGHLESVDTSRQGETSGSACRCNGSAARTRTSAASPAR